MEAKRLLRSRVMSQRTHRSAAEIVEAGLAIAGHGIAAWGSLDTIALYAGVGTEPPTRPLLDALSDDGVRVLLPSVTGDVLDWAAYDGWDRLVAAAYGLLEPDGPRLGADAIRTASAVVVPALAVDRSGHRLGRGRGFYDRVLGGAAATCAVVFDDEILDSVPVEPHDIAVDSALSPSGLLVFGAANPGR